MAAPSFLNSPIQPYTPPQVQNFPVEYFAGVDVSVFFNEQLIDEVFNITFELEERITPVYGYASYTANQIVHGSRIVRGSFLINMRPADYLHEMLWGDEVQGLDGVTLASYNGNLVEASDPTENVFINNTFVLTSSASVYDNPDNFSQWSLAQQDAFWSQTLGAPSTDLSTQPYFVESGFTILLVYGDLDSIDVTRNSGRIRTIENVHPYRVTQDVPYSGENIMERWDFYAIDMNAHSRVGSLDGYLQSPYSLPGS